MSACFAYGAVDLTRFGRAAHSLKVVEVAPCERNPFVFVTLEMGLTSPHGSENVTTVGLDVERARELAADLATAAEKAGSDA